MPTPISAQTLTQIRSQFEAGKLTPDQVYRQLESYGYKYGPAALQMQIQLQEHRR
ncbi:hypothetical protein [Cupriavidus oxalaticus]|uniref:hypothetical protein n=1 Tax=Cupriavidus oxalaticus TaxID=96344 RepID=UPI0014386289|nr:hypothetical protein [Cupriavidus oxalaticus]